MSIPPRTKKLHYDMLIGVLITPKVATKSPFSFFNRSLNYCAFSGHTVGMKLKLCYHPCAQEHGDVVVVAGGDLDHGGIPNLDRPAIHRRHPERQHGRVHHGLQYLG